MELTPEQEKALILARARARKRAAEAQPEGRPWERFRQDALPGKPWERDWSKSQPMPADEKQARGA